MSLKPDSPDIPEEYLCEIGRATVYWNKLESLLNHTLATALLRDANRSDAALALVAHMTFGQRLDALSAILQITDVECAMDYREKVQPLMRSAQEKRNNVVHHQWYSRDGEVTRWNMTARGKLKFTSETVTIDETMVAWKTIVEAYAALVDFVTHPLYVKIDPQSGQ